MVLIKRIVALALCALMLLPTLVGCKKEADDADDTVTDTQSVTETEEIKTEAVPIELFADGKSDYKYYVSRKRSVVEPYVERLNEIFSIQFGAKLPETQTETDESKKLIFEVVALAEDGTDPLDWSITAQENGDLYFKSNSVRGMKEAINRFIGMTCQTSSGVLKLPALWSIDYDYSRDKIDNSSYLSWAGHDASLEKSGEKLYTPEWFSSLVMVEFRVDTASIGGTFDESYDLLEHYAACGVNGVWLGIFYERGGGNGYSNNGPHTVEPLLTGVADSKSDEAWNEVKEFVDYAHSLGMYIFMDVITWGVNTGSELTVAHPDWFEGKAWGGQAYNWRNAEFREWYVTTITNNILRTGVDGLRCDCEPEYTGYTIFNQIRERCKAEGVNIAVCAEAGNTREDCYDTELESVFLYSAMDRGTFFKQPFNWFIDGYLDVVDTTLEGEGLGVDIYQNNVYKRGTDRFYTYCLSNHDFQHRVVKGNRLKMGYTALFSPYVPLFYMGDEFGDESRAPANCIYFADVDFGLIESDVNKAVFFEDFKKMMQIRREYAKIFEYFPENHRESNICKVEVEGVEVELTAYARYMDFEGIMIIPNNDPDATGVMKVHVPLEEMEIDGYNKYRITDLMTDTVIAEGSAEEIAEFTAIVEYEYAGVYHVEVIG